MPAAAADSALSFKEQCFEVRLLFGFSTVSDASACNQQPRINNNHKLASSTSNKT